MNAADAQQDSSPTRIVPGTIRLRRQRGQDPPLQPWLLVHRAVSTGRLRQFVDELRDLLIRPRVGDDREAIVVMLAEAARQLHHAWPTERAEAAQALATCVPVLAGFVSDSAPAVRRVVPHAISAIGADSPAIADAVRAQAADEHDALALTGQLRALDELGHRSSACRTQSSWFAAYLRHPSASARLAAVAALARRDPAEVDIAMSRRDPAEVDIAAARRDSARDVAAARHPDEAGGPTAGGDAADLGRAAALLLAEAGREPWRDTPWQPRYGAGFTMVGWLADRFAGRPQQAAELVLAAFGSASPKVRHDAVLAAGVVLARWRLPMPALWAAVAAAVTDPDSLTASAAADLLAAGGEAARPHTEVLLARATTGEDYQQHSAIVGLARLRDVRALPMIRRWVSELDSWPLRVRAAEVLTPWGEHRAELLPEIRARLARDPKAAEHLVPVLGAWGPAAADAVPELCAILDTRHAAAACAALGAIGPAAAPAAEVLRGYALGVARPRVTSAYGSPLAQPGVAWHGRQLAAWAYGQITGDRAILLAVAGAAVRRRPGHAVLRLLAELGPAAQDYAGDLLRLLDLPGGWSRVEAAYAFWRVTGDPGPVLPVLTAAVQSQPADHDDGLVRTAVRRLGGLGRAASPALPLLDQVIAAEHRYGWSIRADEELRDAARAAAAAIRA